MKVVWKVYTAYGKEERMGDTALAMVENDLRSKGCWKMGITAVVETSLETDKTFGIRVEKRLRKICRQRGISCTVVERRVNPLLKAPGVTVAGAGELWDEEASGEKEGKRCSPLFQKKEDGWNQEESPKGADIYCVGFPGLSAALQIKRQEASLRERFSSTFLEGLEAREKMQFVGEACFDGQTGSIRWYQAEEGGVFAALWEMAKSCECGFEVDLKAIPMLQEVIEICEYFQLNPYLMQSAGCMLAVATDDLKQEFQKEGIPVKKIGYLKEGREKLMKNGEEVRFLDRPAPDEWLRWLGGRK